MTSRGERRLRILAELVGDGAPLDTNRLCALCTELTGMTGAGIMLMTGDVPHGSVCTTDEVSALIEQLQFDLGEGPCIDAYQQDLPVLEPDLARPARPRWVSFTGPAVEAGARAVVGFQMQVGAVRLGALNLYRDRPGPLDDDQHADALLLAETAAQARLLLQADAPPPSAATELESKANFQVVVHQASGMVAAQLDVSVGEAFVRLRAYAFGNSRSVTAVARDVVERRLRLDDRRSEDDPSG